MVEIFDQSPESKVWKATIPQISAALTTLFSGDNLKSKEILESEDLKKNIREVYALIELIRTRAPEKLRNKLFLWPNTDSEVPTFIHDLREEFQEYKNGDITKKIIDDYEELFERGWEWSVKKWKEILSHYNPNMLNQILD